MTKKTAGYYINYTTNTITVTKRFLEEAAHINTAAFNIMKELRQMDMAIVTKEAAPRKNNRITYAQMIQYISLVEDSGIYMAQFEAVRAEAKSKNDTYNRVLNWFRMTFPCFYDMPTFNEQNQIVVNPAAKRNEAPATLSLMAPVEVAA